MAEFNSVEIQFIRGLINNFLAEIGDEDVKIDRATSMQDFSQGILDKLDEMEERP